MDNDLLYLVLTAGMILVPIWIIGYLAARRATSTHNPQRAEQIRAIAYTCADMGAMLGLASALSIAVTLFAF